MKKLLFVIVVIVASYGFYAQNHRSTSISSDGTSRNDSTLTKAIEDHASHLQVEGEGAVVRILSDDTEGSRHQRFILRLATGQTILIAHNIDLAPRVSIREGDVVAFSGEYEWNEKGGVVHWTHRDPAGRHPDGWLKSGGQIVQ